MDRRPLRNFNAKNLFDFSGFCNPSNEFELKLDDFNQTLANHSSDLSHRRLGIGPIDIKTEIFFSSLFLTINYIIT